MAGPGGIRTRDLALVVEVNKTHRLSKTYATRGHLYLRTT